MFRILSLKGGTFIFMFFTTLSTLSNEVFFVAWNDYAYMLVWVRDSKICKLDEAYKVLCHSWEFSNDDNGCYDFDKMVFLNKRLLSDFSLIDSRWIVLRFFFC